MNKRAMTRRSFLRGAGGAVVGLPLLASLGARAQANPQFPLRFIVMLHPNGTKPEEWFPTAGASETEFTLKRILQPLVPFQDRLLITSGIDMPAVDIGPGEPHQSGMGGVLTGWHLLDGDFVGGDGSLAGWGAGVSVDQRIAEVVGMDTPFRSLELGVRADHPAGQGEVRNRMIYLGPEQPLAPENQPLVAFDRLFTDLQTDVTALAQLRAHRRSVIDAVTQQFTALQPRLGHADRQKLDSHLTLVRDLEQRLQGDGMVQDCTVPAEPAAMASNDENTMPAVTTAQMDLIVAAMTCDLTRVASVQFSNGQNHIRFPWLAPQSLGDGHTLSHAGPSNAEATEEWIARDNWYAQQLAYLMTQLDSVPEGDGTLLDNTIILWVNELAVGNTHSHQNMPFLIAGGAGGKLNMGRYLQYTNASHVDLLNTMLTAFDIQDTIGNPDFATGPLAGMLA
jgi:hypothetical protein